MSYISILTCYCAVKFEYESPHSVTYDELLQLYKNQVCVNALQLDFDLNFLHLKSCQLMVFIVAFKMF